MNRQNRPDLVLVPGSTNTGQSMPALLSLNAAAGLLGISAHTLRKYIARGELARIKLARRVLIDPQDLQAFIRRHKERRVMRPGG